MPDDKVVALNRDDPDPMAAFAPASEVQPEQPWPHAALLTPEMEAAAEPEKPEEPRPEVKYIGHGGDRQYKLLYPLKIEGREIRMVTVRHPTLWTVEDYIAGKIKTNFALIGAMSDISETEAGALRWPDAQALIHIITPMLPTFIQEALEAQAAERK